MFLDNIKTQKLFKKRKIWDRIVLKSNFQNSKNLKYFTLTWSNARKMNSVRPDMTYLKELQQKNENVEQTYLEKHLNYTILVKYCAMAISRNSNRWVLRGISPRKELQKYMKIFQFNRSRVIKFFLYNIHSERNKTDTN